MLLSFIDWIVILIYLLLTVWAGFYFSKQAGKSLSHFFLGGRDIPWFLAGLSMVATTFAADTPLAVTELVAKSGISGNWLWWNALLGGTLTTFFFARLWRRSEVFTDAELVTLRYSGKEAAMLRIFKSVYFGLFLNTLVMGWVNLAMIGILEVFFGLNPTEALLIVGGIMLMVSIYTAFSGLLGVIWTDAIQFVIAMGGCIILAYKVLDAPEIGGLTGLAEKLPASALKFFPSFSVETLPGTLTLGIGAFFAYAAIQWWASWYPGAEPGGGGYIAQRILGSRNEKGAVRATLFFQLAHYALRPWPWILVGLASLILYPELGPNEKRLGYIYAMRDFLPDGLRGLMLVAFLAAYMSTISTQLNLGVNYLINDGFKPWFDKNNKSEKFRIMMSRILTIFLFLISLVSTTGMESVTGVWQFLLESGAGLGFVLIMRWYWWRLNAWSEITAMVVPLIVYGSLMMFTEVTFPDSYFITVGITVGMTLIVTMLTPPSDESVLLHFHQKIQPNGWWPNRFPRNPKMQGKSGQMLISWLSATVCIYSILFLTGAVLFSQTKDVFIFGITAIVSGIILYFNERKIFPDESSKA